MFDIFKRTPKTIPVTEPLFPTTERAIRPPVNPNPDPDARFSHLEDLLFAVGVESELSFMPNRIKRMQPFEGEEQARFERRKLKAQTQMMLLNALNEQAVDQVIPRFLDIVEKDAAEGESDAFTARNMRNDSVLCQSGVIQSVFRQAVSTVLFNEHLVAQKQADAKEKGDGAFGAEDIGRNEMPEEGATTAEPGRQMLIDQTLKEELRATSPEDQIHALGLLFPKLSKYKMGLEQLIDGWDMFEPRPLEYYSAKRDEGDDYEAAYTFEDSRVMYGWSLAQRAARAADSLASQKRMMRNMLVA